MSPTLSQVCPQMRDAAAVLVRIAPNATEEDRTGIEKLTAGLEVPVLVWEGDAFFQSVSDDQLAGIGCRTSYHVYDYSSGLAGYDAFCGCKATIESAARLAKKMLVNDGDCVQIALPGQFVVYCSTPEEIDAVVEQHSRS